MKEWLTAALFAESSSTRSHIENATSNVTRFLPATPLLCLLLVSNVKGMYHCSFRTTTRLNARTATRCSRMRRTWDITTKPITSFRIRKRRQHLESKSLLLQIRFGRILLRQEKNIFHSELSNLDFACIYFYLINPTRKATRKTKRTLRSTLATCVTSLSCLPSLHSGTWGSVCWGWALINTAGARLRSLN